MSLKGVLRVPPMHRCQLTPAMNVTPAPVWLPRVGWLASDESMLGDLTNKGLVQKSTEHLLFLQAKAA